MIEYKKEINQNFKRNEARISKKKYENLDEDQAANDGNYQQIKKPYSE